MPYTHVTIKLDKTQAVCADCGASTPRCDTEAAAAQWALAHRWKIESQNDAGYSVDFIRCPDCATEKIVTQAA